MTEEQERERPVVHKRAVEMLEKDPVLYLPVLLRLYAPGTVVPAKDIPELIVALDEAMNEMDTTFRQVLDALEEQQEEAEEKEKEKATT